MKATALADLTWALSLPLSDVVADYLEALRAAGRSPRTIEWYRIFLLEFIRFVERAGYGPTCLTSRTSTSSCVG